MPAFVRLLRSGRSGQRMIEIRDQVAPGFQADGQAQQPVAYAGHLDGDWERSDQAGYLQTHVALGSHVATGDLLATLHNPLGNTLREFRAKEPGFVMAVRHLRTLGVGDLATCVVREVPFALS